MKCLYFIYTIATIPNFCYRMKFFYFIHYEISNFTSLEVIDAMFIFCTASYTIMFLLPYTITAEISYVIFII